MGVAPSPSKFQGSEAEERRREKCIRAAVSFASYETNGQWWRSIW